MSIADLAVISNLLVFHYLGHRIDSARHPNLPRYFSHHLESQLLRQALADERPFVEKMGLDRSFLP